VVHDYSWLHTRHQRSWTAEENQVLGPGGTNQMITTIPPLALALGVIFGIAILGAFVVLLHHFKRFAGFREIADEVRDIAQTLHGEIFRDGGDLVASGNFERWPTVVRFSKKENVPGVNIRVGVPANFTLWIAPRSADPGEGRATVRTGDMLFDSRFLARTDDPGDARLFVTMPEVQSALRKLACSNSTFLTLTEGWCELSELEMPAVATANHLLEHLHSISVLATTLQQMPGTDRVRVEPLKRERRILGRAAIVGGAIAAILVVVGAATQPKSEESEAVTAAELGSVVVMPRDAERIADVTGWRVATTDDFDPNAAAWLRFARKPVEGRITADFSGVGQDSNVAYVLVREDGVRRVVLLVNGESVYDFRFPAVAIAARVPKGALSGIEWVGSRPSSSDGDGLLIVRSADDPKSGLIVFTSGRHIVTGVPANYQSVSLQ